MATTTDIEILKLDIHNEMDVMLSHRRAMQFAKFSGMLLGEQTRFATAVSELSRNVIEHAEKGKIAFKISRNTEQLSLQAVVTDEGKGIASLKEILNRQPGTHRGRGLGLVYAKRLTDTFEVKTSAKGTTVTICKAVPGKKELFSKVIVDGWVKHLKAEPAISAYEELKIRNSQLLELTEELTANNEMVEAQMTEIRQLNAKLADNNKRMKDFTYAISHDLKNPLSSLKLATEQLNEKSNDGNAHLYVGVISRSVNKLDKTIHSLIEILDVQNQDQHITRKLDFSTTFQENWEAHTDTTTTSGATFDVNFSKAPTITYIEGYLTSIFHNLINNAIKYRSDKEPRIVVRTEQKNGQVILVISDNGIGMDMQTVGKRLFQPFARFNTGVDGKGIGLYLIKGMIENNGGTIVADSQPGVGTTFTITLNPYKLS